MGDGPSVRVSELPLHDVPQNLRAFLVEGGRQRLQLALCLGVETSLLTDAIAPLAGLGLRW
jgi:hypothetical protein